MARGDTGTPVRGPPPYHDRLGAGVVDRLAEIQGRLNKLICPFENENRSIPSAGTGIIRGGGVLPSTSTLRWRAVCAPYASRPPGLKLGTIKPP